MKTKLFFTLVLSGTLCLAQLTKMEAYLTGTKVSFYPNQCGNSIPESIGKLSFCDKINNLGVVEESYGLNDRRVLRMLSNHFNDDEYYVTSKGLSIRNTDGSWENIPNIAIPPSTPNYTYIPTITNGLVLPDGRVIIQSTNASYGCTIYDRTTKNLDIINFPTNRFPYLFAYDPDRAITWIVAYGGGGSVRYLYTYDGTTLGTEQTIPNLDGTSTSANTTNVIYKDNALYFTSLNGLYKVDISNYQTNTISTTQYNTSTTVSLPFDRVNDLQFTTNGELWLAQSNSNNSDGGIVNFDIDNGTYQLYQIEQETNATLNHPFNKLAINDSGILWALSYRSSSLYKLTFPSDVETWETTTNSDLDTLGVPVTYVPSNLYFKTAKFYFTTVDFSSSVNLNNEVIINDNGVWSSRNDDAIGNLSSRLNARITKVLPDSNGGVWWFNGYDNIILHRDNNDNIQSVNVENLSFAAAIDSDDKPIVYGGSPSQITKVDIPNAISIQSGSSQANDIKRVADQVWVFDRGDRKIDAYKNNVLVNTYNLDEDWYSNSFHFDVDEDGNAWFMRYESGFIIIKKFDISTLTSTTYDLSALGSLGTLRKVIAAPNNGVWFLGSSAAIYKDGETFYDFKTTDYSELNDLKDLVVDSNGKAYVLTNNSAKVVVIENPTSNSPTLSVISLESTNAVMPSLSHYRPDSIAIDSEGSIWTHASNHVFKLVDNDFSTQYTTSPETLSLQAVSEIDEVQIYPNPTSGLITVDAKQPIKSIHIYNVLGETINTVKGNTVNLSGVSPGIYIMSINLGKSTVSKKVIVN